MPAGTPVYSSPSPVMLAPLHQTDVRALLPRLHRFCQITLVQGSKKSVRASACIIDSGGRASRTARRTERCPVDQYDVEHEGRVIGRGGSRERRGSSLEGRRE